MKATRQNLEAQLRTLQSQISCINTFGKVEDAFLQKFFIHNIADYFSHFFDSPHLKPETLPKSERSMLTATFLANKNFTIQDFEQSVQNFYGSKSESVREGHISFSFKHLFSSCDSAPDDAIKKGQMIFVHSKIRADVQKIEEFPEKILGNLKRLERDGNGQMSRIWLKNKNQYLNILIAYCGDCNFSLFNQQKYQSQSIKLWGKRYRIRIFVFYISRQALFDTFKTINKLNSKFDRINDLAIQFYELRRDKRRSQRRKIERNQPQDKEKKGHEAMIIKALGICGLFTVGLVVRRLLS